MNDKLKNVAGYILAGGESSRFDYQLKGLIPLHGKPLLEHVIERFAPQLDYANINTHFTEYAQFGLPTVGDRDAFLGPLFGLYHCMQHQREYYPDTQWLAITACDAPFIPADMVARLLENQGDYLAQCIHYDGYLQPTFSVWHNSVFEQLEAAIKEQQWGGLKIFLHSLADKMNVVEYPKQDINPFFNINSQQELAEAVDLVTQL